MQEEQEEEEEGSHLTFDGQLNLVRGRRWCSGTAQPGPEFIGDTSVSGASKGNGPRWSGVREGLEESRGDVGGVSFLRINSQERKHQGQEL